MSLFDITGGGKVPQSPRGGQPLSPWILGTFQLMAQPHGPEHGEDCGHDHTADSCCGGGGHEPHVHEFSYCARIADGQPEFLSMVMAHPGHDGEPPQLAALRGALFEPMIPDAPRPPYLLVSSETEKKRLEMAGGTYGLAVRVDTEIAALTEELSHVFAQMQEDGTPPLEMIAPMPDGEEIDEPFVSAYLAGVRELFKAAPWRDMDVADLFRVTLPDGSTRYICLMGQGGQQLGALFFNSVQDFAAFNMASVSGMLRELQDALGDDASDINSLKEFNQILSSLPDEMKAAVQGAIENPPVMPEVIGLNFNPSGEAPGEMEAYLDHFDSAWLQEDVWPHLVKYHQGNVEDDMGMIALTPAEFALVRDAALALARTCEQARRQSAWPPAKGYSASITLGAVGSPAVRVDFLSTGEE